jgi:hypothetical protein
MAYAVPPRFSHGSTVSAAEMQKYSDGLNAIHDALPLEKISWGIPYSNMEDTQTFFLIHKRRWLIYKSTGEIQHPTEPETYPAVSLSDTGGICAADLDQEVDWLVPGMLYKVVGCSVCFEDDEGIIT